MEDNGAVAVLIGLFVLSLLMGICPLITLGMIIYAIIGCFKG